MIRTNAFIILMVLGISMITIVTAGDNNTTNVNITDVVTSIVMHTTKQTAAQSNQTTVQQTEIIAQSSKGTTKATVPVTGEPSDIPKSPGVSLVATILVISILAYSLRRR
jgi:hypothetical protein